MLFKLDIDCFSCCSQIYKIIKGCCKCLRHWCIKCYNDEMIKN